VPDPFAVPGHRRILSQDGDHLSAAHRPARLGKDRQRLIREDPVRFRVRLRSHRFCRPGDQPGQHLPRDRQPLNLLPARLDQPREPRGLLLQPQPLDPPRHFPLAQQPQDLIVVRPPTPTETRSTNPYQPGAEHRKRVDIDAHRKSLRKKRTRGELQIGVALSDRRRFVAPTHITWCGAPRLRSLTICRPVRHGSANTGNAGEPAPA
jgi:hypothetical protein